VDLKQVAEDTAARFGEKLGISFLETSAKTATNVDVAFLTMSQELIAAREKAASGAAAGAAGSAKRANVALKPQKTDTKCCK